MTHNFFLFASALGLAMISQPALAVQAVATAETPSENSVTPDLAVSPGFALVEHRITGAALSQPASEILPGKPRVVPRAFMTRQARARVLAFIRAAEMRHALPYGLLEALVEVESAFQPGAVSRAGAMGLSQLMPATARALGVFNPFDPRANVDGGARYLRAMLDRFGSTTLALAAYNAGPGAVLRSRGVPANGETPGYVRKVLAIWSFGGVR